ncbi:hypothetical protein [Sporomusa sp.]|uniref:hypothetical protein n=1 Tax=Sporomusa sp. TaxID=2078658 RepID=UPI002BCC5860|nr:hypothetical protein [Sporomusa sp.]HWR42035.1 hypothetical protein [Sporomusa sp.]
MVTKILAIQRIDLSNRNHRGATDGAKKKSEYGASFKEILRRELAVAAQAPGNRV